MRRFVMFLYTIFGYPISNNPRGPSAISKIYGAFAITTTSFTYLFLRFLFKILFPTNNSSTLIEAMAYLNVVSSYEIVGIVATNIVHFFCLVRHCRTYGEAFKNGKVFDALTTLDVVLMVYSVLLFLPQLFRDISTIDRIRFVSYLNTTTQCHMIMFQYCAILKYHIGLIRKLTSRANLHLLTRNENSVIGCVNDYIAVLNAVRESDKLFRFRVFFVFVALSIDLAYILCFIILTALIETPSVLMSFHYATLIFSRIIFILYLNGCCHTLKTSCDEFLLTLFGHVTRTQYPFYDRRLCLVMNLKPTLTITACGWFSYGYPLVISVISAAATYLVILLQFSYSKK